MHPVLLDTGWWLRSSAETGDGERREEHQYEYVKHLGLNTIRFEGMLQDRAFLERCDEDGLLVIAGFCC
ncbi:MAG TPA: hypothetical protein VM686_34170, partial [Polyangiaceae bacterium]|nr:hypothetical protein [Polyangiaceae bacterium]